MGAEISTISIPIQRFQSRENQIDRQSTDDLLAVEEPLEIRLAYGPEEKRVSQSLSITMRTPGNDFELAAGFLFTEGIISDFDAIEEIRHCGPFQSSQATPKNVVRVELRESISVDLERLKRHFYTTSSCGVCGKTSIEALRVQGAFQKGLKSPRIESSVLQRLPHTLAQAQGVFNKTGGLHASALFDTQGSLIAVREDVGRHNAMDKLVGAMLKSHRLPLDTEVLLLSGRMSFELVQKAAMAGVRILAAVGAPSSLAVELAKECEMTLVGFLRDERFNLYSESGRIQ